MDFDKAGDFGGGKLFAINFHVCFKAKHTFWSGVATNSAREAEANLTLHDERLKNTTGWNNSGKLFDI